MGFVFSRFRGSIQSVPIQRDAPLVFLGESLRLNIAFSASDGGPQPLHRRGHAVTAAKNRRPDR
jgi:hypothetical protein